MATPIKKVTQADVLNFLSYCKKNPDATQEEMINDLGLSTREAGKWQFIVENEDVLRNVLTTRPKYRVLLAGDLHCGHLAGLTPKGYGTNPENPMEQQFVDFQKETWDFFEKKIMSLKPFTHAIWNGDLIEGRGKKSKGTELIYADRLKQVEMAATVIDYVNAPQNVISYGTPYHVGDGEDFERVIAEKTDSLLNAENLLNIGGVIINAKHHTNGTSTPYGAGTPLLKDALWGDLWAQLEDNPTADVVVRSHTHTFLKINDGFRTAIILPALQGALTKYGTIKCSKVVHWGFAYMDIYPDKSFTIQEIIYNPEAQKRKVIEL